MIRFLVAVMIVSVIYSAFAAPPAGSPGRFSEWFASLRRPDSGTSCCDESDCRMVRYRVGRQGYEVEITPASHGQLGVIAAMWVPVPQDKIITPEGGNPTGEAVVCWMPQMGVLCFVRPPEG